MTNSNGDRRTPLPISIKTRSSLDPRQMDLPHELRELRRDLHRRYVLWRRHPRAVLANYARATKRCFTLYDDNSHTRKAFLLVLTLFLFANIAAKTALAFRTGSFSSVVDIPTVVVAVGWLVAFAFELGQEIDAVAIGNVATIDFDTGDDTDD
jgi:hypothetical protein